MYLMSTITPGGYVFGEVTSAMQKAIRAGDYRQAYYWALEIQECGEKTHRTYLWNRLKVICSEDIGPTPEGNQVTLLVNALADNYEDAYRRDNGSYFIFLAHAVIAMCKSEKSRLADELKCCVMMQEEKYSIPDNALGPHTAKGKAMGRGLDFWLEHGVKIHPRFEKFAEESAALFEEMREGFKQKRKWKYDTKAAKKRNEEKRKRRADRKERERKEEEEKKLKESQSRLF